MTQRRDLREYIRRPVSKAQQRRSRDVIPQRQSSRDVSQRRDEEAFRHARERREERQRERPARDPAREPIARERAVVQA